MQKAELLRQICERIQEVDSQKGKDKQLAKTSRELKKAYEFLKKYKTDDHLNELFQKEFLSDSNASTRLSQKTAREKRPNNGKKEKEAMGQWLQGCEICNNGLVVEMKKMVDAGVPVNKAAKLLAEMAAKQIGEELYSAEAISARYRYHIGQRNPHSKSCQSDKPKIEKPEKASNSCSLLVNDVQLKLPPAVTVEDSEPETEKVCPQVDELGADYLVDRQKAAAKAQQRQESELERADRVIRKAARLLEMIVEGQIEDNGSDIDRLSAESIRRHGPGIITSFIQLGIDVFKVHEFYTGRKGGLSASAIELKDLQASESNLAVQDAPHQRVPDTSHFPAMKGSF